MGTITFLGWLWIHQLAFVTLNEYNAAWNNISALLFGTNNWVVFFLSWHRSVQALAILTSLYSNSSWCGTDVDSPGTASLTRAAHTPQLVTHQQELFSIIISSISLNQAKRNLSWFAVATAWVCTSSSRRFTGEWSQNVPERWASCRPTIQCMLTCSSFFMSTPFNSFSLTRMTPYSRVLPEHLKSRGWAFGFWAFLLMGEVQLAACRLSPTRQLDCTAMKKAKLERVRLLP